MNCDDPNSCYERMMSKTDVDDSAKTVSNYDSYPEYDTDIIAYGHSNNVPRLASQMLKKYAHEDCRILDIACGSGIVGHRLRQVGFKGVIHGLDGSDTMLDICKKKEIYDAVFQRILTPSTPLELDDNFEPYGAVVCIAGFGQGHISFEVINSILSLLADDGILLYSLRTRPNGSSMTMKGYNEKFKGVISDLEGNKVVCKIDEFFVDQFYHITTSEAAKNDNSHGTIYCYKKV